MDINWAGADVAMNILEDIHKQELIPYIEESLIKSEQTEDFMWIGGILRLVDRTNTKKEDFVNPEIFDLLKLYNLLV